MTTFARACPVSLSRDPLSPGIEATPKTDLSLSRSLVHRQTWRVTGFGKIDSTAVQSKEKCILYVNQMQHTLLLLWTAEQPITVCFKMCLLKSIFHHFHIFLTQFILMDPGSLNNFYTYFSIAL